MAWRDKWLPVLTTQAYVEAKEDSPEEGGEEEDMKQKEEEDGKNCDQQMACL